MRVLQILPELHVGGVETGTVDFAKYLQKKGHHAVVVSNGGALVEDLSGEGIQHYQLPVHKKSLLSVVRMVKAVRAVIHKENVDIVHARSRIPAWIAFFACRRTHAQFITTCHGYYATHFISRIMGWAKLVIVPSTVIGRHMVENFRVPPENIRCIPRSVNLERFKQRKGERGRRASLVITIVGRVTPLKGHATFIKAMAKVARHIPYVKIWIVGDAPKRHESYKASLQLMVKRLGLADNVQFLGTRRDVPELLIQSDVLVMASKVPEAFGRVILEAQAVDVPVVATRLGGALDIIEDGKTGLLVPSEDPDAMAQAVLSIAQDRKLGKRLAAAARKRLMSKFTLSHMAEQTIAVYEELLATPNILVIKFSSLGDVILSTPSLRALRQHFPRAKIFCLVGREVRQILQHCPYLDGIIVIDVKHHDRSWWAIWRFSRRLRQYHFDKVIDLQNNRRSHLLAWLSFARETYGYDNGKASAVLAYRVKDSCEALPPVEHQFRVLNLVGVQRPREAFLEMWLSKNEKQRAKELLAAEWVGEKTTLVGINLAASYKWKTKNWPVTAIARLCDNLAADGVRVVVTGTADDAQAASELLACVKTRPAVLVGKTDIMTCAAVIKRCQAFVTPDSAPMHMAAAVGTPFVALFGPTDPARHVPPAKRCVVISKSPQCSPCYSVYCRVRTHVCMTEITPEEVHAAVQKVIKDRR